MLTAVLERVSEDTVILAELVYLEELSTPMEPEPALDYVSRRCGVCCTRMNDACIVSQSPRGLAQMVDVIVEVCRAFALTMTETKRPCACLHRVHI